MSDETDPSPPDAEDLDPAESVVRDLLASAPPPGPVPQDVATRLDARLAELLAERGTERGTERGDERGDERGAERGAAVSELASRRRRARRVNALLGAAAAVVVGGVALTQVPGLGPGVGSSEDASVSAEHRPSQDEGLSDGDDSGDESAGESAGGGSGEDGVDAMGGANAEAVGRVSSDTLVADLVRLRDRAEPAPAPSADGQWEGPDGTRCLPPTPLVPGSTTFAVLWDGEPALVVLEPFTADGQPAQVRGCGARAPVREVVLPLAPPAP